MLFSADFSHPFFFLPLILCKVIPSSVCVLTPSERRLRSTRPSGQGHARNGQPGLQHVHAHDPEFAEVQTGTVKPERVVV